MATDEPHDDKTQSFVALTPGTEVLHYKILEKIGAGGMGEVYLALDTKLNRKVALKFLPHHLCQDEDCRRRFTREAQAAAALDHPNIAAIYEVGEHRGRPFYAMQVVEGKTLKEAMAGKDLPLANILAITLQLCEGLQAAHDKGIIHRDIKPSNILIDSDGRVRIVDFGLASVRGSEQLTKTGSTLGTIGYMSPEQVQGEKVDHRSDLFAVGVILYEMITGHNPFTRDSDVGTIQAILNEVPKPMARFDKDVSPGLESVVSRLLEKNANLRYQTTADLISDLRRSGGSRAPYKLKHRGSHLRATMFAVLAAAVGLSAFLLLTREHESQPASQKMIAVLPFENIGDTEDSYFTDGITEEVTSRLARISELGVISRTSAMQYKGSTKSLPQIARELGVEYVLEGSVRWDHSGDTTRVRITPQLIDVSSNTHIWTDIYESSLTDVFSTQGNIALRIARELGVSLLRTEQQSMMTQTTENSEAYSLYLRGRELLHQVDWRREDFEMGIRLLERAISLDSTFAEAWSQLGFADLQMYAYYYDRTPERLQSAFKSVQHALLLDSQLGDAHLTMAYYYFRGSPQYDSAAAHLERAQLDLEGTSDFHYIKAFVEWSVGLYDKALGDFRRAYDLDPLDANRASRVGHSLMQLRRYDEALAFFNESLARRPDQQFAYLEKARVFMGLGELDSCYSALTQLPSRFDGGAFWVWIEYYGLRHDWAGALRHLDSASVALSGQDRDKHIARLRFWVYHASGDKNSAIRLADSLKTALESKIHALPTGNSEHLLLAELYAVLGNDSAATAEVDAYAEAHRGKTSGKLRAMDLHELARIYTMVGKYDQALGFLEQVMSVPYNLTVNQLKLDTDWDPLRNNPRFEALIKKYDKPQ